MSYTAGICNFCGTGCGHFLRTVEGRVVAVAPNVSHPVSQGRLCMRGWHVNELLAVGERITRPMVRRDGELRAASDAEAIAAMHEGLASFAQPAGQVAVLGSARSSNEDNFLLARLAYEVLGTRQLGVTSQATHGQTMRALQSAFGEAAPIGSLAEIEHARYILVVGGDLTRLNPIVGSNIHRAARLGSRVVAVSSARTQMAKLATRHLQQRPGTRRTAVNALLKAVLERQPAAPALPGFAEVDGALAALTPGAIESATGLPYSAFEDEAKRLLEAESFMVVFSSGISGLDEDTINSVVNLAAASGKMGGRASGILPVTGICNLQGSFDVGLIPPDPPDLMARLGDPGSPVRALIVVDHDDGIIRHRDRLRALDFVVYVGSFHNRFADLAHVVLPAAAFFEEDGTYTAADGRVQLSPAKARPPIGVQAAWRLYRDIAGAMGRTWNYESARDVFADIADSLPAYSGMTHEALAGGFGRHYHRTRPVACQGLLPIETTAPASHPDAYPTALMVGNAQHFWHQHNLLRKTLVPRREYDATLLQYPQGYIEINAGEAKRLQVRDTSMVRVSAPGGSMKTAVRISDDVPDASACVPYFINEMIADFLVPQDQAFAAGEDAIIPIRIEKL
ncbi:MAG: molybdopterin oxidoreductase family protein [Bacteroidales bacterium]